jgi:putative ABC transport system permease protein
MLYRVRAAIARVRELFRHRSDSAAEQDEEFALHIDLETAENVRRGMGEADARRAALLRFGGTQRFREEASDARGVVALDNLARDTRFALRRLRRAPSFSLGAIATMAVGVAGAVAIGTLVHGVLLRPLPYPDADGLVDVRFRTPGLDGGRETAHSPATYVHVRDGARAFAAIGAYHVNDAVNLTDGDDPQRVTAALMTPGVFRAIGVAPAIGRPFSDADALDRATIPVLISHELWRRRYAGDSAIVGRRIEINRNPRRVVGVMPPGFAFPIAGTSVWYALNVEVERAALNSRYLSVVARLRDGITPADAEREVNALVPQIAERFPAITAAAVRESQARPEIVPLRESIVAPVREQLRLLGLTMLFVLLIAAANVGNLFLLRSERLRHEVAITAALGGGSAALARRFVTEGVVLGLAATLVALPIVAMALTMKFGFGTREIPRLHEIAFGPGPAFTVLAVSLVLGVVVGLMAFARARRTQLGAGLRASERTTTGGAWRRVQQALVTAQVAIALTLLLGAALMGSSLWNLQRVQLGFVPAGKASFELTLPFAGYARYPEVAAFHAALLDRLRAIPGVQGVEAALEIPLIPETPEAMVLGFDGVGTGTEDRGAPNIVTPDYFRLMGIPLLHGRTFVSGDLRAENPAIVLSASLARSLFGTTDALGQLVRPPSPGKDVFFRVVGVVGDVPRSRLDEPASRMAYFPQLRDGDGVPGETIRLPLIMRGGRYVLRTEQPIAALAPLIREEVRALDRRVPVTNITTLPAMVDAATARVRLTMLLLAAAAAAAVLLGVIGIYTVVSYAVAGRQREFGVRVALGATSGRIERMVMREGTAMIALGAAAGMLVAMGGARLAQSMLYGVTPTEPALYVSVTMLLMVLAFAATLVPARRAAHVNPADVMRGE